MTDGRPLALFALAALTAVGAAVNVRGSTSSGSRIRTDLPRGERWSDWAEVWATHTTEMEGYPYVLIDRRPLQVMDLSEPYHRYLYFGAPHENLSEGRLRNWNNDPLGNAGTRAWLTTKGALQNPVQISFAQLPPDVLSRLTAFLLGVTPPREALRWKKGSKIQTGLPKDKVFVWPDWAKIWLRPAASAGRNPYVLIDRRSSKVGTSTIPFHRFLSFGASGTTYIQDLLTKLQVWDNDPISASSPLSELLEPVNGRPTIQVTTGDIPQFFLGDLWHFVREVKPPPANLKTPQGSPIKTGLTKTQGWPGWAEIRRTRSKGINPQPFLLLDRRGSWSPTDRVYLHRVLYFGAEGLPIIAGWAITQWNQLPNNTQNVMEILTQKGARPLVDFDSLPKALQGELMAFVDLVQPPAEVVRTSGSPVKTDLSRARLPAWVELRYDTKMTDSQTNRYRVIDLRVFKDGWGRPIHRYLYAGSKLSHANNFAHLREDLKRWIVDPEDIAVDLQGLREDSRLISLADLPRDLHDFLLKALPPLPPPPAQVARPAKDRP